MEFLAKYLWNIFETVAEENNDGDDITVDLVNGPSLFLHDVDRPDNPTYKCNKALPLDALKEEWLVADQPNAYREYTALVARVPGYNDADKCAELCKAFTAKDKKAFEKAREEGLKALYKEEA